MAHNENIKLSGITIRLPSQQIKEEMKKRAENNMQSMAAYTIKLLSDYLNGKLKPIDNWYLEKIPDKSPTIGLRISVDMKQKIDLEVKNSKLGSINALVVSLVIGSIKQELEYKDELPNNSKTMLNRWNSWCISYAALL
ncbi:hypothetical protein [Candidatus Albibeggiatoa sp. nov. BB20]|uniref:hypothetical protein n=1 Tax=Candidatus Albibeggiatoa sp. nov. BB20 TaxID=3162723 RepID=UPI00336589E8